MSNSCEDCASANVCDSKSQPRDNCKIAADDNLKGSRNHIKNVIAIMSGKGGVGKSSITALLASEIKRQGFKTGVLDADISGASQAKAFGIKKPKMYTSNYGIIPAETGSNIKLMSINFFLPEEDDPVIWRGPLLASAVNNFWQDTDWQALDFLLVDLPPGTGDIPLTVLQSLPVTGIILVTSPQDLAGLIVTKTIKMVEKIPLRILGLIENMSYITCTHCNEQIKLFGSSNAQKIADQHHLPLLAHLPLDPRLAQLMDTGRIESYNTKEIEKLTAYLLKELATE